MNIGRLIINLKNTDFNIYLSNKDYISIYKDKDLIAFISEDGAEYQEGFDNLTEDEKETLLYAIMLSFKDERHLAKKPKELTNSLKEVLLPDEKLLFLYCSLLNAFNINIINIENAIADLGFNKDTLLQIFKNLENKNLIKYFKINDMITFGII
jgi:hypothetical protein